MKQSEILIIGAHGQLGKALHVKYPRARTADVKELDITNQKTVQDYDWSGIKVIVNAAAYTNVDGAETAEGKVIARQTNDKAVGYLANIANQKDLVLVHISTDYVFDGTKKIHTEKEIVKPLGVYGATKAGGDKQAGRATKHYIIRTSWVIGDGPNFARAILNAAKDRTELKVAADQFGRPTFTVELVRIIDFLLSAKAPFGTYNGSNSGEVVHWADFARAILKEAGSKIRVANTTAAEYFAGKVAAERPAYSTFDLSKLAGLGYVPADWHRDLKNYIQN